MPSLVSYFSWSATCATGAHGSGSGRYAWGHQHCVVILQSRPQLISLQQSRAIPTGRAALQFSFLSRIACWHKRFARPQPTLFIPLRFIYDLSHVNPFPRRRAMLNVAAEGWSLTCSLVSLCWMLRDTVPIHSHILTLATTSLFVPN